MERAEQAGGWQNYCREHGLFAAPSTELVSALAEALGTGEPVLELGAGDGALAAALARYGVPVTATDPEPRGPGVLAMDARSALALFQPPCVLSCFAPSDAGVERAAAACPAVKSILSIGPVVHGQPAALWNLDARNWREIPAPRVNRYLLSRYDYTIDFTAATWRQAARAVLLRRTGGNR